jgi:hypothetical protein
MTVRSGATRRATAALALSALLTITSCAAESDNASTNSAGSPAATPHGHIEGATEAAEQQARLLLNDPAGGESRVLDLVTGRTHRTQSVTGAGRLATDGRFGYLPTGNGVHVVDTGAWTVDHGDHVHYYSARTRDVGRLPAGRAAQVRGDATVTAVTDDGRASLYDRGGLADGTVPAARTLAGTWTGAVIPYAEHLVALAARDGEDGAELVVLDRDGERVTGPDATCERPAGDAVTRRGLLLGCADGALLVRAENGTFTAERIPYGEDVPAAARATAFRLRPGSDTLTAHGGDASVWLLDVGARTWTRVRTGPVRAANTAGEGSPLLVLETDGRLHGYDTATGEETARTDRLLTGTAGAGDGAPVIEVDRSRAYVNDPGGRTVYEIDYNDGLRVARTFALDITPALMAETGR